MTVARVAGEREQWVGNRYQLLSLLGAGGMGQVYRARDRLTGETVALKRVATLGFQPDSHQELRLALAHEFQALAGLRHPNIIGVRDYGFAADGQPYFTMELLYNPRSLVAAGQLLATDAKVALLLPVLHALAYLHRRNIIHRDLKPGNILVSGQTVKVLDFGLATITGQTTPPSGTLRYMAPEVLRGAEATVAADLYAVGVIAYELFAGWHPFAPTGQTVAPELLHTLEPDWSYVDLAPPLIAVLQRLLAKAPAERYPDAAAVIAALGEATGQTLPVETVATRESFLQAAPFVGREAELAQLTAALAGVSAGQGSAWLIGGESGVGKSRLLTEVRTHALVQGVLVVRGRASSDGGGVYHLWRDVLRWLLLLTSPTDLEAAVLKPLLPDIAELLGRPIADAPVLEAKAAQTRLLSTVATLFQQATGQQPLLLLLEDIHWADENSLELLQWLTRREEGVPAPLQSLFIIATYRRGEAPTLPARFPGMHLLMLHRLLPAQIEALSVAMLGANGRRPHLVSFLQQETEGNTFFVVETLRALAEAAGQLDQVAAMALPTHVFPEGVQQVVQRRLQRVPLLDQPLLQIAAVAGRQLDLAVLQVLLQQTDHAKIESTKTTVEQWLTTCANAAVLERQDDRWHFAHDKLREGILIQLEPLARQHNHQQIAGAIEQVHQAALPSHYPDLAFHYGQAQNLAKERHYLFLSGETAQAAYANAEALEYYQRLLPLLDQHTLRIEVLLRLGRILRIIGRWDAAEARCREALELANQVDNQAVQARCLQALGALHRTRSEHAQALALFAQARSALATLPAEQGTLCELLIEMGNCHYQQGAYRDAQQRLEEGLRLARQLDNNRLMGQALHTLGNVTFDQGDYQRTKALYEESLAYRRLVGDKADIASTLNNLGILASYQADDAATQQFYEESLALRRAIGDKIGVAVSLNNLGIVTKEQGDLARALALYEESLAVSLAVGDNYSATYPRGNIATIYQQQGNYLPAQTLFTENFRQRQAMGDKWGTASALVSLGDVATGLGNYQVAHTRYLEAMTMLQTIGDKQKIAFCLVGMAAVAIAYGTDGAPQVERAITLAAAASILTASHGLTMESDVRASYEHTLVKARTLSTETAFTQAWDIGVAMTADQAMGYALSSAQLEKVEFFSEPTFALPVAESLPQEAT